MNDIQTLIGRQRAEFELAARYFHLKFITQFVLALIGATTVLIGDNRSLYWVALFSLIAALLWLFFELKYRAIRANAERVRRATLVMGGLGKTISVAELNDIRECLKSSKDRGKKLEDAEYFASRSPAGLARLAEMLEESAYWTLNLQKTSALFMWLFCALVAGLSLLLLFALIPAAQNEELMQASRVICAILTFSVGTDMLGAARAYTDTAKTLERIMHRFDASKARGYEEADLLLMVSDYNATVENTPLSLPFMYDLKKKSLNENWQQRQSDHGG